jgi:hypothetical protein
LSRTAGMDTVTYVCGPYTPIAGRGERIRTSDILLPKQARYRTALHPERQIMTSAASGAARARRSIDIVIRQARAWNIVASTSSCITAAIGT